MNRELCDKASSIFKFCQKIGQGRGLSEWTSFSVAPVFSPEPGNADLNNAILAYPSREIHNISHLEQLISAIKAQIKNKNGILGKEFTNEVQLLAANVGAAGPLTKLDPIITKDELLDNIFWTGERMYPGAQIESTYTLEIVSNLRSSGIGRIVAVKETPSTERIYYSFPYQLKLRFLFIK